jgi:hypothetical protein
VSVGVETVGEVVVEGKEEVVDGSDIVVLVM